MASISSVNSNNASRKRRTIIVTGPPLNGRDDYLTQVVSILRQRGYEVAYHSLFSEMQKTATRFSLPNLTRANVLKLAPTTLPMIRSAAYTNIAQRLRNSKSDFDFVSSPGIFRIRPSSSSPSGRIDGLQLEHLKELQPDLIIVFIADLLEVKKNLGNDPDWRLEVNNDLRTLAEWRKESIELISRDAQEWRLSENNNPLDWTIFAQAHPPETLAQLCIGDKPRIYISFAITLADEKDIEKVSTIRKKLEDKFVCLDPNAIKDWQIITEYDKSVEKELPTVEVPYAKTSVKTAEVQDAIDELRSQTVQRDFSLIQSSHATVVLHIRETPSNGVMSEMIFSRTTAK